MDEKYLIGKLIDLARENERQLCRLINYEDQLAAKDEELQKAYDKIAMLESVELLAELKDIENGTRKE